ncbi:hypothetical protein SPAN111604_13785 [Sphingomonas antarctica]|uniref:sensor domain-containing diguanylate cyclase n=1 Tax=Sphingomonas antarctica TaxID=2040274 RepID=UPI0039E79481
MQRGKFASAFSRWPWLTAGLVYTLLATITIRYTRLDGGVALVWVANGFLIPWLSLNRQRLWPLAITTCIMGNAIATVWTGVGWGGLGLPVLNLLESVVTAAVLRRWLGHSYYLDSIAGFGKFALVATLFPTLDSPVAGLVAHYALGQAVVPTMFNWFVGHSLGVIMVAPLASLVLRSIRAYQGAEIRRERLAAFVLWVSPVAAVSAFTFSLGAQPLLFLPLLPMMLATLRLGRLGAAASAVTLALIASVATVYHSGPIYHLAGSTAAERLQFLQFYLAITAVTLLPVAVLMRQRRTLLERLSTSESALRLMAENSGDAMLHTNAAGRIIQATGALEALLERDANWVLGRFATELVVRQDRDALVAMHLKLMADPQSTVDFEYRVRMRDGSDKWFESRARALLDADGLPVGTISAIRDIEARKRTESELEHAATTDQLTGIANRRAFFARFDTRFDREGVLIVADLDHFKTINDRFGHHVGDAALQSYARVARGEVRASDLIARIGGEEFAYFLPGVALDEGYALCARLREALAEARFDAGKAGEHTVTASMGMVAVNATDDAASALKRADLALYAAKEAGRDCLRLAA